jgi:hypothetical protein
MSADEGGPSGPAFWIALVLGWAVIGYGAVGLVQTADDTHPLNLAAYFVGSALAHDLVVAPIVLAVGWFGVRRLRPRARTATTAALVVSGAVVLYSLPFVLGLGRDPDNPSRLPNNYGVVLAVVVALVSAAAWIWARMAHLDVTGTDDVPDG